MQGGRPSKYDPEYCMDLIDHMTKGLSFEAFAGLIGCCKDTLYEWVKVYPEFSDAKKIATQKSQLFWESIGIEGLWNIQGTKFKSGKSLNASVWIFNMKNRFNWSDKQEIIMPGNGKFSFTKKKDDE